MPLDHFPRRTSSLIAVILAVVGGWNSCPAQPPALGGQAFQRGDGGRITAVDIRRLAIGDQVTTLVTGRTTGPVWGDSVYTLDSDLASAAVHAGLVRPDETKAVRVHVIAPPATFGAAQRNGVASRPWGAYPTAFLLQPVVVAAAVPPRPTTFGLPGVIGRLEVGESMTLPVTGSDRGSLWGTDRYTGDSSLEAAAVHAGAVRVGERATVTVTRVPPLDRYEGSSRNGVRSGGWGSYPSCFTVERRPDGVR